MQGLGSYAVSRGGHRGRRRSAGCPRSRAGEVLVRVRGHASPRRAPTWPACARAPTRDGALWRLTRRQDLHLQRRHRRACTRCSPAAATGAEAPRALDVPGGRRGARASRCKPLEPMAPHPLGEVRFDGTPGRPAGRGGQGLRAGPGHAGHLPAQRGRGRLRPGRARPGRGAALGAGPPPVRPRRWPTSRPSQMALADMHVGAAGGAPARAPRGLAARPRARSASRAKAAVAKLFATEMAQRVVDRAVQIHGGQGVMRGRHRGAALPRGARAAHLRGHQRDPEAGDRAPAAQGETK